MADREIEVMIDDEPYVIGYHVIHADEFNIDYDDYAELQFVLDKDGNHVDIDSNEIFYRKCEGVINEDWDEYVYYLGADDE